MSVLLRCLLIGGIGMSVLGASMGSYQGWGINRLGHKKVSIRKGSRYSGTSGRHRTSGGGPRYGK